MSNLYTLIWQVPSNDKPLGNKAIFLKIRFSSHLPQATITENELIDIFLLF